VPRCASPRPRARDAARHDGRGHEVRQDRGGGRLADPARTTPSGLPVLAERRRPRRGPPPEGVHVARSQRSSRTRTGRARAPESRAAQRELARGVTRMVHGGAELARRSAPPGVLFGGSLADATAENILTVFDDAPSVGVRARRLETGRPADRRGCRSTAALAASKSEAVRLIRQGGLYVNDTGWPTRRRVWGWMHAIGGGRGAAQGQRERRICGWNDRPRACLTATGAAHIVTGRSPSPQSVPASPARPQKANRVDRGPAGL